MCDASSNTFYSFKYEWNLKLTEIIQCTIIQSVEIALNINSNDFLRSFPLSQ